MRRRGVSPVIAVLLLIVIAVAAAILTYIWITGYMGTLQTQAGAQQVRERIKIEGVTILDNGTVSTIYVRNIGDTWVRSGESITIYLMDASGNAISDGDNLYVHTLADDDGDFEPGELLTIDVSDAGWTLSVGETYVFKVVLPSGTEATYQITYRG